MNLSIGKRKIFNLLLFSVYVEMTEGSSDTITFAFSFDMTTAGTVSRMWEIKVTQLACNAYGPPPGCLQWLTGVTGQLASFNFIPTNDNHLANQE